MKNPFEKILSRKNNTESSTTNTAEVETLPKEKEFLSPKERIIAEDMSKETEGLLKDLPTEEEVKKLPEEKQKLYFSKTKVLLTALGIAGLVTFAKNYGHLDLDLPDTMVASKEAILEGAGLLLALGSGIALKIRDMYEKMRA